MGVRAGGRRRSAVSAGSSGRGGPWGPGKRRRGAASNPRPITRGLGVGDPKCKGVPGTNQSEEPDLQEGQRER